MFKSFYAFGSEIRKLDESIETAVRTKFNLKNRKFVKFVLRFTGLPHFGARIRAFYLGNILNSFPKSQKVLDAGCGIGLNSFLAVRKGFNVIGIDNDSKKIALAKNIRSQLGYKQANFLVGDLTSIDFPEESFDVVTCFEVMEHIRQDDKAFKEIARVLKKNGKLILSVPGKGIISRINEHAKDHVREGYSLKQLQNKLNKNNMIIEKVIKIEHTLLGFLLRYTNDEIHKRSLLATTALFPIFFPLALLDGIFPEMITPNNWIIVAQKKGGLKKS